MTGWTRRIARARELAEDRAYAASHDVLRVFLEIARFQESIAGAANDCGDFAEFASRHRSRLRELMEARGVEAAPDGDDFTERVLLQVYVQGRTGGVEPLAGGGPSCPFCGEGPVVAVLRPEGEGGSRSLVCSLCYREWNFRRLVCANCGEEDHERLPVYMAEQFPYIRTEVCESCHTYLKCIDMTRNGLAVPEVDDLATVPLDVWAAEQGYARLRTNLFGL